MNAVVIWIFAPAVLSVLLLLIRRYYLLVIGIATTICLLLAIMAMLMPIGEVFDVGPLSLAISPVITFFGRRLLINDADRTILTLIYLFGAFWFFGASVQHLNRLLVPIGLLILSISAAALSVEPFLYSAMLIEVIVLLSVPIAAPPGAGQRKGVMRYLTYLTMGMPFILLAGWAAERVQVNLSDPMLLTQAVALLVIGFVFWLAVFPVSAWVAGLMDEVHPYIGGFILAALSTTVLLLLLDFINAYSWLRNMPGFSLGLHAVGLVVVLTSGTFAMFQSSLPRLFAMAYRFSIGVALIAISPLNTTGYLTFLSLIPVRLVAFGLFALSLGILLKRTNTLDYAGLTDAAIQSPLAFAGVVVSLAGVAGLPLFGNFSLVVAITQQGGELRLLFPFLLLLATVFLLAGGARAVYFMTRRTGAPRLLEDYREITLISIGILLLILIGTFPRLVLPMIFNLLKSYQLLL